MSGADESSPELEDILKLVAPPPGLTAVLDVFDGPEGNLGEESEAIIRREADSA